MRWALMMRWALLLLRFVAAPGAVWHPIVLEQAAPGFDTHDPVACLGHHQTKELAAAMCTQAEAGGSVQLRGCVQCHSYDATCFDAPDTLFATLPAACRVGLPADTLVRVDEDGASARESSVPCLPRAARAALARGCILRRTVDLRR